MADMEITQEQWKDATNQYVVVTMWSPKPGRKKQAPVVKVSGDYPSYSKAYAVKKRIEKQTDPYYSPERRTIYVARKFDVSKLDLFNTYHYPVGDAHESKSDSL